MLLRSDLSFLAPHSRLKYNNEGNKAAFVLELSWSSTKSNFTSHRLKNMHVVFRVQFHLYI